MYATRISAAEFTLLCCF